MEAKGWAPNLAGGEAAGGVVELDDGVLACPAGNSSGGAVEIEGPYLMVEHDAVADLQTCGGLVGSGSLMIVVALADGGLDRTKVVVEGAGGNQTDEDLDLSASIIGLAATWADILGRSNQPGLVLALMGRAHADGTGRALASTLVPFLAHHSRMPDSPGSVLRKCLSSGCGFDR